jgi:hypothetical protein
MRNLNDQPSEPDRPNMHSLMLKGQIAKSEIVGPREACKSKSQKVLMLRLYKGYISWYFRISTKNDPSTGYIIGRKYLLLKLAAAPKLTPVKLVAQWKSV